MVIESITNKVGSPVQHTKSATKNAVDAKPQASATMVNEDTVSLKNIQANDTSTPVANEARIANLKAAIESGSYRINPEQIASKMMQLDFNLPNTT